MPEMPSADVRTITNLATTINNNNSNNNNNNNSTMNNPIKGPEFNISSKDVEGLVNEIKENLRLSAGSIKAIPYSHLSRKSSRASPYRIPGKMCYDKQRKLHQDNHHHKQQEDPYELLQKLLRDGSLVNEAVRRVQLGLTPKQRYFYESDEDCTSPVLRLYSQD